MKTKKLLLSILLSLALMLGLMPGMTLDVKADNPPSESAAETLKPTVNAGKVTAAKKLWFARQYWYVIASGNTGVRFDTSTVSKENGQTTLVLLAAESEDWDEVKFSENGSLNYSTSVLKATIDGVNIESSLIGNDSWMKDLIAKRTLTGGASSGQGWSTVDNICGNTVTGATLWPLSAYEASQIDSEILKYGDNNRDWWLRSPGYDADGPACVSRGNVSSFRYDNTLYVRPALCLNLTDDISASGTTVYGHGQIYSLATNYPLQVGGVQVTSANASNIDGENKASYNAETHTLTLNGYSYSGSGYCIDYTGTDDLNIELTGKNTITITDSQMGIHANSGNLCFTGTGSLSLNSNGACIYNNHNITIENVTLNVESVQGNGINCGGTVTIANSRVTSKGLVGITGKNTEINKSTVECSGSVIGINSSSGTITIGSDITSLTVSGKDMKAILGTVKNSVAGMGWDAVDGTGDGTEIAINKSGASLESYKKLLFPYKKPVATVSTAPTAKSSLTYNGSAQELITPGDKGEGAKEMQYALGKDATTAPTEGWSTSIPKGTDAGTYYVWYKAVGDAQHIDSEAACVTATISEPEPVQISHTVTFKVVNGSWNDGATTDKTAIVTGYEGDTLKLSADQIPAVGDKPGNNYKAGSWDKAPDTTTPITDDTIFTYTYAPADNEGNINNEVVQNPDTPKSTVDGMTNELAESLMTDDEKARLNAGENSTLILEITNTDNTVPQEDKNLTENEVKKENSKAVVAMYLDISLFLNVGSSRRQIDNIGQRKLTVNIEVPSRFWAPFGVRRTFFVVRTHKNNAETIAKSTENIVPVDTGLFSTYALAYVDEPINVVRFDSGLKISQKNGKIKVSWDKTEGVAKYEVYATYCGKKFPKKPTKTTKSNTVTIKKIKDKKIDFTKNFKLYVKAYDSNGNIVGKSVHAHFAGKNSDKYKNPKEIKLDAKTITLDKGQSTKIKASVKMENGKKKALPDDHVAKLRYRSNNENVAKVDKKGNVTAVGTGTCTVYVYAKNGLAKKVAVTVN